jgi:hypothetical protein
MSRSRPVAIPAGPVSVWLDAAVSAGLASTPGDPIRSAIFDAVHEDRGRPRIYAQAAELLGSTQPAVVRMAGIEMAAEAMRAWRAALERLTHLIAPLLTDSPVEVGVAAAEALGAARRS